ncbi:MAG: hypothetical protein JWR80_10001 [Bradyrhizobium sp.]|nr:hypothetical protein [Bradyrhizobium sp.]
MRDRISTDVYILSQRDLDDREQKAFTRGVERGKFEAAMAAGKAEVAINCGHWKNGRCGTCGAQWQGMEVSADFKCPHFVRRA